MKMMKSIVYERYGGPEVLKLLKGSVPSPNSNEVLIKVISSSVTAADWHLRKADPFMVRLMNGFFKPKQTVLGQEFYGEVVLVGNLVQKYRKGDRVFGSTGLKTGAHAEFISLDEQSVMLKAPEGFAEELATVPIGALTAMYFLEQTYLKPGDRVLINGASGSVGSYAVQIAKAKGAIVTGVCSTSNVELVQKLGADSIIDYKKEKVTDNKESYTLIFDTVGNLTFKMMKAHLTKSGVFASTAFNIGLMVGMMKNNFRKGKKVFTGVTKETTEALGSIKKMLINKTVMPVIDRTYGMEEIREAHEHAESGRKKGNVLLMINGGQYHV